MARAIAHELGFVYVDSGAMYRALTWLALRQGIDAGDEESLSLLAKTADIRICQSKSKDFTQQVFCQGQDVTEEIRSLPVSRAVSKVSAIGGVREAMVEAQKGIAANHDVVMEGRDIGTVVLPDAECKIYLTASAEERASRRKKEREGTDRDRPLEAIVEEIVRRDHEDMNRRISPLRQAEDSILLDTTFMSFEEAVQEVLKLVEAARGKVDNPRSYRL